MKEIVRGYYTGERPLFGEKDLFIKDTIFTDGESPLKESSDIKLSGCMFKWKYPLWYSKNISVNNSTWFENARAGVWYTENIEVTDCRIEAPKNFRRCNEVVLKNISFPNAAETLWNCKNVRLDNITAKGDYFAMNSENITCNGLSLYGNYSFDGVKNAEINDSYFISKDAFWNCENVTVKNSFISGEYIGWNSKNITFINCTIESLQGLCYIDGLKMKDCKLINTVLAFEFSSVEADIEGKIDSITDPSCGRITADSIGEIIIHKDRIDPSKTVIVCRDEEN